MLWRSASANSWLTLVTIQDQTTPIEDISHSNWVCQRCILCTEKSVLQSPLNRCQSGFTESFQRRIQLVLWQVCYHYTCIHSHMHTCAYPLCLSHTHTTHTITTHTCTHTTLSLSHSHTCTHTYSLHTHSLFSPRTETCKVCEFKIQIDTERDSNTHQQLTLQWDLHKVRAESAYQSLREDTALTKSSGDTEMFTFDLQQALVTPTLMTNVVFYKRQLWTYNLGLHDCKTGRGFMHMWHEGLASRGSQEIASCILYHLSHTSSTATKVIILYSDACGGQNRNINMVCLWLHIVASPEYTITQVDQS